MKNAPLLNLALALVLILAFGWIMVLAKSVVLPIVTAVISVYIMGSATEALRRVPILSSLPTVVLRIVVLVGFSLAVVVLVVIVVSTVRQMVTVIPTYQDNLISIVEGLAETYDLDSVALWDEIMAMTIDRINLQSVTLSVLGGFTSVGSMLFLVILYAAFMMSERTIFLRKMALALPDTDQAERTISTITDINRTIADYLSVKTLVNLIIAGLSYAILWAFDVDFAIFWAILIGVLNYIPYVGSYVAVAFPVLQSLAQFGSLPTTGGLLVLLTAAQILVGNVLDPRMVGRQVNLSPFVVLVALAVWSSLWGVPGAILAVPLTSMLAIGLSRFEPTRSFAILLAERVDTPHGHAEAHDTAA